MFKPCPATVILPAAAMVLLSLSSEAFSQSNRPRAPRRYRGVTNEPYVSPYLQLVRPDSDPGFNYYTLVQPQEQQLQFNQRQTQQNFRFGQQMQQTQAEIMTPYGPRNTIRPTGRIATRMNYSHYYPDLNGGPAGGGRQYKSGMGGGGMGMGGFGGMGMGGFGGMGMGGFGGGY